MVLIGVLVPTSPGAPSAPPEALPLGRAALALGEEGVDLLLAGMAEDGLLVGHRAVPGGWRPARGRPAAVYDRFPSQGRATQHQALLAQLAGLPVGNPPALVVLCRDKLATQRALEAAGLPMPAVEDDPDRFAAALDAWGAAFLKPRFGAMGAGVRRVVPGDPLPARLRGLQAQDEPALLQRAVPPPPGLAGRSLRVLAQRAPDGAWVQVPAVVRESEEDPVVNAARGARVRLAEDALPPPALARVARMVDATCRALAATPGATHALELGVDLVLDPDDQPHLVEVNGRPNGRLERLSAQDPDRFGAAHLDAVTRPLRTLAAWVALLLALVLPGCGRPGPPAVAAPTRVVPEQDGLRAELVTEGSAAGRAVGGDGADLVLLYGGEEAGQLGPCGCDARPRGGLARVAAYRDAVRAASPGTPVLLLQAGGWMDAGLGLDGAPRPDAPARNAWMVKGLLALAPDVVHVGAPELHGLASPEVAAAAAGLPLVSANLRHDSVPDWRVVQAGELRVGITGIAAPGPAWMAPPGWSLPEPLAAARALLAARRAEVDLVVLLALQSPEVARSLAQEGLVDVVIDANRHHEFSAPFRVGRAVWVRSHDQAMRLGELRLHRDPQGVTRAWDRKVDLDEAVLPEPTLAALVEQADQDLARVERALHGRRLR